MRAGTVPSGAPGLRLHPQRLFGGNSGSWLSPGPPLVRRQRSPSSPSPSSLTTRTSADIWQITSGACDTVLRALVLIACSRSEHPVQPSSASPAGEASEAWKNQYLVYLTLITELTALNKGCAGGGGHGGCALQLCQYRSALPAPTGGRSDVFNRVGSKRSPIGISAKSKAKIIAVCVQPRRISSSSAAANHSGTKQGSHPRSCCLRLEKWKKKKRGGRKMK